MKINLPKVNWHAGILILIIAGLVLWYLSYIENNPGLDELAWASISLILLIFYFAENKKPGPGAIDVSQLPPKKRIGLYLTIFIIGAIPIILIWWFISTR